MKRVATLVNGMVLISLLWVTPSALANEDDPISSLQELGDALLDEPDTAGGRQSAALKSRDRLSQLRLQDTRNLEARVTGIKKGSFPTVALKVKVVKAADEGAGAKVQKNQTLVVFPRLKFAAANVDLDDDPTLLNAGAYYLQRGDRVMIRLGYQRGRVWEADYIERK